MIQTIQRIRELANDSITEVLKGIGRFILYRFVPRRYREFWYSWTRYLKNKQKYELVAHPYKTFWIATDEIVFKAVDQPFPSKKGMGFIHGGDWDKDREKIDQLDLYDVYFQRFKEEQNWEETGIIEIANNSIQRKGDYYGYTSIDEVLKHRCRYIDELYERIQSEGYKSQGEKEARNFVDDIKHRDYVPLEIEVVITRDGEILFFSGHNRMVLAKLLNVPEIPVMVLARHRQWQQIRESLANNMINREYMPIESFDNHPDLENLN